MVMRQIITFCAMLVLAFGCVSSKTYEASLAEIGNLHEEVSMLREQLRKDASRISDLNSTIDELTAKIGLLEEQNEVIKTVLEEKRSKLKEEVVDLRTRMAEMEAEAEALEREKERALEEKEQAISRMKGTYDSLVAELTQEIKEGEIQISQLKDRLTVNLVDKILFDSGSAVIKQNGKKVLDRVAGILKTVHDRQIKVEGHTDNVPIGTALAGRFPSNWELSTARATTVVRYLQERGVDPRLLSAEGYGEYRPVAQNDSEEGRSKNRRIEITLIPIEPHL